MQKTLQSFKRRSVRKKPPELPSSDLLFVAIAEDKRRANDNTAQFLLQRKRHWTESQSTGPRANERKKRHCEVDASQAHAVQRQGEQDLETDSDVAAQANATDFDVAAQANATDLRYAREHEFFMRVGRRQRRRDTL